MKHENQTIGALASAAGVNVETVRFYQRRGLVSEPERPQGGVRRYGATELARIRFIRSAQRLGFSLDEVAQLLELDDGRHCEEARQKAQDKLADVRNRLRDLKRMAHVLSDLVDRCGATNGQVRCPLIEALQGVPSARP